MIAPFRKRSLPGLFFAMVLACVLLAAAAAHGQCALAKLLAPDGGEMDNFGAAIAISEEVVVVGAPDVMGQTSGAAYVYRFDGEAWNFEAKLVPSEPQPAQFFGTLEGQFPPVELYDVARDGQSQAVTFAALIHTAATSG